MAKKKQKTTSRAALEKIDSTSAYELIEEAVAPAKKKLKFEAQLRRS